MKNIVLGSVGCLIAVYTIVLCLSIYSISARKNEIENCMAQVLEQNMKEYYGTGKSNREVEDNVRQDLAQSLHSASELSVNVKDCDMEQGILAVCVLEKFILPGGSSKSICCEKTIIVE